MSDERWRFCVERMPDEPGVYEVIKRVDGRNFVTLARSRARLVRDDGGMVWRSLGAGRRCGNVIEWLQK